MIGSSPKAHPVGKPARRKSVGDVRVADLIEGDVEYKWDANECSISGGVKFIDIDEPELLTDEEHAGEYPEDYHQTFFNADAGADLAGHFVPLSFDESMKGKELKITEEGGGSHEILINVPSSLSIGLGIDGWDAERLDMTIGGEPYKIDIGGAVAIYPVGEKAMDHAEATSEEFGSASDYFSGVTRTWSGTSCRVEGTLRYQKKGSHSGIWKDGNFFAFRLSKAYQGKEITLEHGGEVRKKSVDTEWVVAVDDKSERIRALWGDLLIADFDLSGVTLEPSVGKVRAAKSDKPLKAAPKATRASKASKKTPEADKAETDAEGAK